MSETQANMDRIIELGRYVIAQTGIPSHPETFGGVILRYDSLLPITLLY